jgi:hypothetical protein
MELGYGQTGQSAGWATNIFGRSTDSVAIRFGKYTGAATGQSSFTELMTLLTNGNVGIGTTNPGANKLYVYNGFAKFEYNAYTTGVGPIWPATGNGLVIGWNHTGGHGESNFYNVYVQSDTTAKAFTFTQMTGAGAGLDVMTLYRGGDALVAGTMKATAFIYNSDRRLKKDIAPLEGALPKLMQLQGVTYNWIDPEKGTDPQIGFIAQDVENVVPEVVTTDTSTGIKGIDYARLAPVIVNAVKEQEAKIDAQQKEIDALKTQMQAIRGQ